MRLTAMSSAAPLGPSLALQPSYIRTINWESRRPRGRLQRMVISLRNISLTTKLVTVFIVSWNPSQIVPVVNMMIMTLMIHDVCDVCIVPFSPKE